MATLNVRGSNAWASNPSMKIYRNNTWQDAQGFVYKNNSWEVFTTRFFELMGNTIISEVKLFPRYSTIFDIHTGFYYVLKSGDSSFTLERVSRTNGSKSFTKVVNLTSGDFSASSIGVDENYVYVSTYYNIYKLNKANGNTVSRVAKNSGSNSIGLVIYTAPSHPYIYVDGESYNKSNLIKYGDVRHYNKNTSKIHPIGNTKKVVVTTPTALHVIGDYGSSFSPDWSKTYSKLHTVQVRDNFIYAFYIEQRTSYSLYSYLVKYDINGNVVFEEMIGEYWDSSTSNYTAVMEVDANHNCYTIHNKVVNKYDSNGNRKYMYNLDNLQYDGLIDLFHYNNEIVLWNAHSERNYSEIYKNP